MNTNSDEIKDLLKKSKLLQKQDVVMEDIRKIWNNASLIFEQERINMAKGIENDIEDDEAATEAEPKDKQQKYRVSGGYIVVHGKTNGDLQLTIDEKAAFQDTINEFIEEVSNLVEIYPLNLYSTDVEWSGKIIDMDLEFIFSIGETNGIYVNGVMNKVDEDYLLFIDKLQKFYDKFKVRWGKIITIRKKTEPIK